MAAFGQKRTFRSLETGQFEGLLSARSGHCNTVQQVTNHRYTIPLKHQEAHLIIDRACLKITGLVFMRTGIMLLFFDTIAGIITSMIV